MCEPRVPRERQPVRPPSASRAPQASLSSSRHRTGRTPTLAPSDGRSEPLSGGCRRRPDGPIADRSIVGQRRGANTDPTSTSGPMPRVSAARAGGSSNRARRSRSARRMEGVARCRTLSPETLRHTSAQITIAAPGVQRWDGRGCTAAHPDTFEQTPSSRHLRSDPPIGTFLTLSARANSPDARFPHATGCRFAHRIRRSHPARWPPAGAPRVTTRIDRPCGWPQGAPRMRLPASPSRPACHLPRRGPRCLP